MSANKNKPVKSWAVFDASNDTYRIESQWTKSDARNAAWEIEGGRESAKIMRVEIREVVAGRKKPANAIRAWGIHGDDCGGYRIETAWDRTEATETTWQYDTRPRTVRVEFKILKDKKKA